ncbi:dihydrolipoyl dehydrogenase family protein [Thermomonospora cellulosilytica]|uniref:Pyruvate/2-oxoglutarate dehydrogenase complex dihydrolipoamide dehydrogenase (E3) component n=1 Tax=Thermomonospora cellulosilytica TaxID=1411118 RepID=A0A7W3MXE0_9ACTN|nr:NAD(P)/FAD-dependent oxidoreductase [Thermomonospora cellulosilytica]MBA9003626.1 pyruvate/2-oxoglutarate dehydrogenase complex dihydrolipoamide dehydrogenase (E3) component [Thermomonospora cellulosilytica]
MAAEEADVVVIGMGPGGENAAGRLAEAGLEVVAVEARLVGGECPYWGCVPTKMMIRAADLLAEGRRIPGMSGDSTVTADWTQVAKRIREEATDSWDDRAAAERFARTGGRLVRGYGRITAPGEVTVDGRVFRARRGIVLNPGTEPNVPPIDGLAGTPFWTNREAVEAEAAPGSLVVLGGGAIGTEMAQAFARFRTQVTVVEARDRLLAVEEPEACDLLYEVFEREGVTVHTGTRATAVHHDDAHGFTVDLDGGGQVHGEALLVAIGRRTRLRDLGVGAVGLDEDARFIETDEWMRAADGVWAIGDVTGKGAFTHVSMYQADVAVRDILGQGGPSADYRAVPRVTFTDPEVGAVGLTEAQARERGINVRTGMTRIPASSRGWIHGRGNEGFIKLVQDADRGVLVGATSAGPNGGEVLSALAVAVHGEVPAERLRYMIYAYPTFHRAIQSAVEDLYS